MHGMHARQVNEHAHGGKDKREARRQFDDSFELFGVNPACCYVVDVQYDPSGGLSLFDSTHVWPKTDRRHKKVQRTNLTDLRQLSR